MNKEHHLAAVDQPWQEFSEICTHRYQSGNEANLAFHMVRGASASDANNASFCYFERFLFRNQPLPLSFVAQDVTMFGFGVFCSPKTGSSGSRAT